MKLSPTEVQNHKFNKSFRGFDPMEVAVFLKRISGEMQSLMDEHQALKRKQKQTEVELQEYKEREDLLKKTLANATKMSDRIKEDSDREAKLIISDAQHKAEMITRDARDSLKKIYSDISELRRVRLQFENSLKAILSSHVTMLEQGRRTLPDPIVDETQIRQDLKELNPRLTNLRDPEDISSEDIDHPVPQLEL